MEFDNFGRPEAVESKESENKRKKKSLRFRGVAKVDAESKQVQPEKEQATPPKRFNEALIESLVRKDAPPKNKGEAKSPQTEKSVEFTETAAEKEVPKQPLAETGPNHTETDNDTLVGKDEESTEPDRIERTPESEVKKATEPEKPDQVSYDDFPTRELSVEKGELSIGEGVIHLADSGTVVEVPLHGAETKRESELVTGRRAAFETEHAASILRPQIEQQHMASGEPARPDAETLPPIPEAGGGGEVPPTLPLEEGRAASERPEPEPRPIQPSEADTEIIQQPEMELFAAGSAMPNAAPAVSPSERPATKQELDQAFARSAQIHEQRGVLSGLLFGTWFANRGLRRRQKRETKELRRQGRQLEQLSKQVNIAGSAQESQHANAEQRFRTVNKRFENLPQPDKSSTATRPERPRLPTPTPNEQLAIPENHHVETSAWHNIEVDNKTGKPVETPTFQYGHEYYQERSHENGPAAHRNAVAGELAVIAATGASVVSDGNVKDDSNRAAIPSAAQQGPPSSMKDKAKDKAKSALKLIKDSGSSSQAGPIWPWAVALVAVILVLVAVIR